MISRSLTPLLFISILAVIIVEIPIALLPPTARDALIYHLAYPKLFISHGSLTELPFAFYSYYPMNIEMLYTAALYLGCDRLPALIHMMFGFLAAFLVFRYLRDKLGRNYALAGALIFLSTPIIVKLSTIPYVDLALAFFCTSGVLLLLRHEDYPFRVKNCESRASWLSENRSLIISAAFAGLSAGTKYNGLFIIILLSLLAAYISKNRNPYRSFFVFIFISSAVASPWYIKNAIQTGNPFEPLFFNLFGGLNIPDQPTVPVFLKRHIFYGEDWMDIVLVPFRVFLQGKDDSMQYFDGLLNPIYLIFLPFALFRADRNTVVLAAFSIIYLIMVFFSADMQARFIVPVLPLLTITTVTGIRNLAGTNGDTPESRIGYYMKKIVVTAIIAGCMILNVQYIFSYFIYKDPIPYITGKISSGEYLDRNVRGYALYDYANKYLEKDARILMILTGDRGYYLDRDYYYNSYLSGLPISDALKGSANAEGVAGYLKKEGYTHLLMNDFLLSEFVNDNLDEGKKQLYVEFSERHLKRLKKSDDFTLYELRS